EKQPGQAATLHMVPPPRGDCPDENASALLSRCRRRSQSTTTLLFGGRNCNDRATRACRAENTSTGDGSKYKNGNRRKSCAESTGLDVPTYEGALILAACFSARARLLPG